MNSFTLLLPALYIWYLQRKKATSSRIWRIRSDASQSSRWGPGSVLRAGEGPVRRWYPVTLSKGSSRGQLVVLSLIFHPEMVNLRLLWNIVKPWNCNTTRNASGKMMENSLKKRCTWYLYCGLQVPESQAEMCADFQCFATSTKRAAVKFELFIDGSNLL
jgi:hypothetical protein